MQMGEIIRHALAEVLLTEQFHDAALQNLVLTISSVMMSPDLKNAKVFFVAAGREQEREVVTALNKLVPFLKKMLAKKLRIRFMPQLRFIADNSFQIAEHIESLLHNIKRH